MGFVVYAGVLNKDSKGAKRLKSSSSKRLHVLPLDVTSESDIKEAVAYITANTKTKGWPVGVVTPPPPPLTQLNLFVFSCCVIYSFIQLSITVRASTCTMQSNLHVHQVEIKTKPGLILLFF